MAEPGYDIVYPRGGAHRAAQASVDLRRRLRPLLAPAAWIYAVVSDTARRVRSLERRAAPDGVRVISVGNLEAGGSGKTPLCIHLLEQLAAAGHPVAYVSRGYRSRAERFDGVTLVGRHASAPGGVRWLRRDAPGLCAEIGDEGVVVADRVPVARLAFSRDKARAVELLAPVVAGGYIILDDAFQTWGVGRDIDVVLVDPRRPFGDGWLLPAGSLREEPGALARADVVVLGGAAGAERVADVRASIRRLTGRDVPCGVMTREVDPGIVPGTPVVAVSAIARPEAFERSLVDCGVTVAAALRYPDHHRYTSADVDAIASVCNGRRCVVTEKDWVKLRELGCSGPEFAVARLEARVDAVTLSTIAEEPRRGRGSSS